MAFTDIYVDPSKQTRTAVTITNSTTTATVTQNGHGYSNSDTVKIQGATEDAYNGNFVISNVTTNTYDYTMGSDPGGSATGSPLASKLNLSGDDGTTSALAWADLQYALDQTTRSASGDRFNIKVGTSEVLNGTLSVATYGTPTYQGPLLFQGYTTTSQDEGKATVSGDGRYSVWSSTSYDHIHFLDLRLINSGSNKVLQFDDSCSLIRCEVSGSTTTLVDTDNYAFVSQCYFTDGTRINLAGSQCRVEWSFFQNTGTTDFNLAATAWSTRVTNCFFSLDNASNAIEVQNLQGDKVENNSILSNGGTGYGIQCDSSTNSPTTVVNNIVEGFSGAGGRGFNWSAVTRDYRYFKYNAAYNNTTNYDTVDGTVIDAQTDNETLVGSAFAKTGSLPTDFTSATFWDDVYAYFAPVDTGNVYSGFPVGSNQTKGAVGQPVGGGAGGGLLRVNMNGNVFG
jgi:hypothetical protein